MSEATELFKRPNTAYMLFSAEASRKIREEYPDMDFKERGRKVGDMWKALSEAQQKKYKDEAARLKAEFDAAHPHYSRKKAIKADELRKLKEKSAAKKLKKLKGHRKAKTEADTVDEKSKKKSKKSKAVSKTDRSKSKKSKK